MSSKGEDYYVSHVYTGKNTHHRNYPWFILLSLKRITDSKSMKYLKEVYVKETPFFILLTLTLITSFCCLYASLPESILLWISLMVQNVLGFMIPQLLYFGVYLWAGLILKYNDIYFSMKACVLSCIFLELFIEITSNMLGLNINTESPLTLCMITILFIIALTGSGTLIENMNNIGTLCLVNSMVIIRFLLIPYLSSSDGFMTSLQPLSMYIYIITGLVLSTWPSLKIWKCRHYQVNQSNKPPRHLLHDMASIPVIRQRRASSIEMPTINQNGVLHTHNKTRRKSLPALGAPSRKVSMSSMDLTILGEAHGMITDLLADSTLPLNVTGTLRIVADMISPLLQHSLHRQSLGVPLLTVLEKTKNHEDQEQVMNQPDLKDDIPLSLKQRLQRNLGVSSRRMSSSYTTTTSATGMPTIDMEYHTKKGNATAAKPIMKKPGHRSKSYAGVLTPSERNNLLKSHSRSFSQSSPTPSSPITNKKELATSDEAIFKVEIERGKPIFFEGMDASESENENNESTDDERNEAVTSKDVVHLKGGTNNNRTKFTLDERLEDVKETPEKEDVNFNVIKTSSPTSLIVENVDDKENNENDDTSTRLDTCIVSASNENVNTDAPRRSLRKLSDTSRTLRSSSAERTDNGEVSASNSCESLVIPPGPVRRKSSRELHMEYEIAISRDIDDMLGKVKEWDFPIFELSEKCNVLTQLAFRIFQLCDFFKTFQIPEVTFLKFFRALESGYHNIPYHNRIHAADVLHGVFYLTQHRIPGFTSNTSRKPSLNQDAVESPPNDSDDGQHDPSETSPAVAEDKYTYGCISDSVPDLELMALYVAAAMHDFDHPGRTNAFLVATLNSKALLYNDRSVLENHHAAAAWSLLVTNPGLNFLTGLDSADFKRLRFIVIEEILSTDLKKHFDFLTEWNAKISDQGGGLNFSSEADRLLIGQMAMKIADISGPSKEWDLHYRWTERIIEEFYQQGEDERTLGMPTSAYMNRDDPKVPQLQASFIKHLVQPLYIAYEKANILPGEWLDEDSDNEEDEEDESGSAVTKDVNRDMDNASDSEENSEEKSDSETTPLRESKKKIIYNVVSDNIRKNHQKWLKIIEEEREQEEEENGKDEANQSVEESEGGVGGDSKDSKTDDT